MQYKSVNKKLKIQKYWCKMRVLLSLSHLVLNERAKNGWY